MKWFGTEFRAFLSFVELLGAEFLAFSVPRNKRNSDGMKRNFNLFLVLQNNFSLGKWQPQLKLRSSRNSSSGRENQQKTKSETFEKKGICHLLSSMPSSGRQAGATYLSKAMLLISFRGRITRRAMSFLPSPPGALRGKKFSCRMIRST